MDQRSGRKAQAKPLHETETDGVLYAPQDLAEGISVLTAEPVFADILERAGPPRFRRRRNGFGTLLHIILEQQVSIDAAAAMHHRLVGLCCPLMPEEFLTLDAKDNEKLLSIKAIQYDIVCNGVELSSGAIRNHRPEVMKKAFAIAGYSEDVLEKKFGGMLHALSLGAPPHGGIAPGIDRIVMLLAGEENLREVVLFPMNQRAEDLMMGAPSEATPKQLKELHIRLDLPKK